MSFVISGTGINYEEMTRTLPSTFIKEQYFEVKQDIGAFDDPEDQAAYIQSYIPADWTDKKWQEFLKRSWAWFRGRYRITATLISLILQVGYKSPHRTINSYVKALMGFWPTDTDDWTNQEVDHPPLPMFGTLDFNRINPMQARTLASVLFDQLLYGTCSLQEFSAIEKAAFVEYGPARTKAGPESPQTVLDEPIVILVAMTWMKQTALFSHPECLRHDIGKHSKTGNGFENYFAFYIQHFFETPKKLDELFTFQSDFKKIIDWKDEEFELVTVSRGAGSDQPYISVVTSACGPSFNVSLRAEKGKDVLSWISMNQDRFTFCFPPNLFSPDLLFFIRSTVSNRLLLVMAQCKNYDEVNLQDLIIRVQTVTPSWLWKSKLTKYQTVAESVFPQGAPSNAAQLALQTNAALQDIPDGLTVPNAKFPILRVFASWEGNVKLERLRKKVRKKSKEETCDVDMHPLAMLHLGNFNRVSKEMDLEWFSGHVQQKEVVHSKRSACSSGLYTTLKRARKPEDDEIV